MREKEIFAQTMAEFFRSYRKSTLYLKGFSQSEGPNRIFLPFQVCLKSERQMQSLSSEHIQKA